MVRTLDFHSKNAGSIPASLIMLHTTRFPQHSKLQSRSKLNTHMPETLRYSFKFVSVISPGSYQSMGLRERSSMLNRNRIFVKQSYILLTWMTYIREVTPSQKARKKKNEDDNDEVTPSFFIYPKRQKRFTLLKAPMAHKTFSQEQFLVKSYQLGISFNSNYRKKSTISGVNSTLFFALYLRSDQTPFESNLFFLQRLRFSFTGKDAHFFTFY